NRRPRRSTMIFLSDHQQVQQVSRPRLSPQAVAHTILQGFNRHYSLFRYSAQRAKALFESGDWHGIQQLSRERIEYYDTRVNECAGALNRALKGSDAGLSPEHNQTALSPEQLAFWQEEKTQYVSLRSDYQRREGAECGPNTVSCRIVHHASYISDSLFLARAVP